MRKGLTLVSVLMLILGIVTLATGIMNVALLNAADGGAMGQVSNRMYIGISST